MTKRAADALAETRQTAPTHVGLMDTYFVGYDTYETTPDGEACLPPKDTWWKNAQYRPSDMATIFGMHPDERLMWRLLNAKRNICLSGAAGAGKSHLLKRFISSCEGTGLRYRLTAPTGIAAFNVGGETIHSAAGLGLMRDDPDVLYKRMCKIRKKYVKAWNFFQNTDILIIDEVSMVTPKMFNLLNYMFQKAKGNNRPFGNTRVIMVGDFTQLGPIIDRYSPEAKDPHAHRFVFDTDIWQHMALSRIFLDRSYRQKEGDPFLEMLNEIRCGEITEEGMQLLQSRMNIPVDASHIDKQKQTMVNNVPLYLKPVDLFPYKHMVDTCNRTNLEALVERTAVQAQRKFPFYSVRKREHVSRPQKADYTQAQNALKAVKAVKPTGDVAKLRAQMLKKFPFADVTVALGAQVMMRNNQYITEGIYNGSMGIVTAIERDHISVRFAINGAFATQCTEVKRAELSVPIGKTMELVMSQFPLTLAYGATIHKCQGLTLDSVRINGNKCFAEGQLYVALSRVRRLQDLYLMNFNISSIMANPKAVAYETINQHRPAKRQRKLDQPPPLEATSS